MEVCLFCNEQEKSYKPEVDFICGGCVILLADADQADLKRAYAKALDLEFLRKARALEFFIIQEEKHGRKPDKSVRRNIDRKRVARTIRG